MLCPKCKYEIDNDSYYCDQCGQEISYCQTCHKPGKGNRCTSCGGIMIASSIFFKTEEKNNKESGNISYKSNNATFPASEEEAVTPLILPQSAPEGEGRHLVLSNNMLNLVIEGKDNAIIGRRQGIYSNILAHFPYISGTHGKIQFDDQSKKWTFTDLNSSNGSKYNHVPLKPNVPCVLQHGSTIQLADILLTVSIS